MPFCFRWRISPLVLFRRLRLASAPPYRFRARFTRPAVVMGRAYRSIWSFVACPHVVPSFEFWRPGILCWSPVRSTLRQLKSSHSSSDLSRWFKRDFFLPLLVAPELEAPQRVPARFAGDRYLSGLRAGDCGLPLLRLVHARVWMVACLPLLREWRQLLYP